VISYFGRFFESVCGLFNVAKLNLDLLPRWQSSSLFARPARSSTSKRPCRHSDCYYPNSRIGSIRSWTCCSDS